MHRVFTTVLLIALALVAGGVAGVHCPHVNHYLGGCGCHCDCCCECCTCKKCDGCKPCGKCDGRPKCMKCPKCPLGGCCEK